MKKNKIILLLSLIVCQVQAYDFEADGIYYNITSRFKRTVEVTHWEEQTGDRGQPQRVCHHHNCAHHQHEGETLTEEHLRLIRLDEEAVQREKTAYVGDVVIPEKVWHRGIKYRVTGIGSGSFYTRKHLTSVTMPAGIKYIGDAAFENCRMLREIHIPDAVTHIGAAAFRQCSNLSELVLPKNLHTLDIYTFAFCEKLVKVQMGASLVSFPGNAFFHCIRLKSVTLLHTEPPIIENNRGLKMNFNNITFYVPENMLPVYQRNEFWNKQTIKQLN